MSDERSSARSDEQALVERARHDPDAFASLYRDYVGLIHAFAYRRTRCRELAEDITAATFERALRNLAQFDGRRHGFKPWLFRIAANEVTNHYRRQARADSNRARGALHALHGHVDHGAFEMVEDRVDSSTTGLLDALATLPPRYQEALSLRFLAELSLGEAAAAMRCSKPAMSVTVHRALTALRAAVSGHGGDLR